MGRLLLCSTALLCLLVATAKSEGGDALKQFECKNGMKVQMVWKCDGDNDCGDNSDETDPECLEPPEKCPVGEFRCDWKVCLPESMMCDGERDCLDGWDERPSHCKPKGCEERQFECGNGGCIPWTWVCDGSDQCSDGSDERNCSKCSIDEHKCRNGACIQKNWICDGDDDCGDGSDEKECSVVPCDLTKDFLCGDKCWPLTFKCDGDNDCIDRSDEEGCDVCQENEFLCADKTTCIHKAWVCDANIDCPDADDESFEMCRNSTCSKGRFQCRGHPSICVSPGSLCDGKKDCLDGSDEESCHNSVGRCGEEEMECDGRCVHKSKQCDGFKDCQNGEDEPVDKCHVNECLHKNGGCQHKCVDLAIGRACQCYDGFRLYNESACVDINECEVYGTCSHKCHNEEGTYSCSCDEGYAVSRVDRRRCEATVPGAKIIFSRNTGILTTNLDGSDTKVVIGDTERARGMDYDYKTGYLFYTDHIKGKQHLFRSHMNDGKIRFMIVKNINSSDNLAVDWIYDHIYWTDTGKLSVEVANFDGTMRKTLINDGLDQPRALAVDPMEGYIFWSDWGMNAKIERADMDGTQRKALVVKDIKWPNGISLDLRTKRLYWGDAKLNVIESVRYDGSARKEVKQSPEYLHHLYSLTIFEDWIYWTDWETLSIYKADKFDGGNMTNVMPNKALHDPITVHIIHPYRQPRHENRCADSQCSHLCFPKPRSALGESVSCACPDGLQLLPNKKLCGLIMPSTSEATPVTTITPKSPSDTIVIDFEPNMETTREMDYAILTIIVASGVSLLILFIAFFSLVLYKLYLNGNIKIMNFDNPMYKKTATSPYNIEAQLSYPSTPSEEARHPLTSTLTMESTVYQ